VPVEAIPEKSAISDEHDSWVGDLWEAMKNLPAKQRQTVAYHYLAGFPHREVAEIVGGSEAAARRSAADGIATLRRTYLSTNDPRRESR